MKKKYEIIGYFLLLSNLPSCQQQGGKPVSQERDSVMQKSEKIMEDASKKREENTKRLHAMNDTQLIAELQLQSVKGNEPFNVPAYSEMISRGNKIATSLKSSLTKPDKSSFLSLLALRKINDQLYKSVDPSFKSNVLIDALKNSRYFNTWGLPHIYWEDGSKAIIELGKTIRPALIPLLRDTTQAPVWGSEEYLEYSMYKYRICDYAMAMINEIDNKKMSIPIDVRGRDSIINVLIKGRENY